VKSRWTVCHHGPIATTTSPKPDREAALRVARRRFLRRERFDVSAIAAELGLNRVTLYRWFGSRDAFLIETVWSLTEHVLTEIDRGLSSAGAARIVEMADQFLTTILGDPGMQNWLSTEAEQVMRLCTRHDMGYQPRLIAAFETALAREVADGAMSLDIDTYEMAFVIVRLLETYTYLDLITGEPADAKRLTPVLQLLLRP
jgi:AcrR family transcriptional regulator